MKKPIRLATSFTLQLYPSDDCGIDHLPMICKLRLKIRKRKRFKAISKWQYEKLSKEPNLKNFTDRAKSKYKERNENGNEAN